MVSANLEGYVGALGAASDLTKPPPELDPPFVARTEWHWDVADDGVDQALERWTWPLTRFGRANVVRAAAAMLARMLPVWDAAAESPGPGIATCLENIERGFDPSPARILEDVRAWLDDAATDERRAALADALATATQGDRLDLFDAIGNDEFRALWPNDPWMFVLTGAYATAIAVYDDESQLARAIGNVAVSCRLALTPSITKPRAALETWRALAAALT